LDDCFPPDYVLNTSTEPQNSVETLDLIQYHTWEDAWLDDPRTQRTIETLRSSGKVRAVGISLNRWERKMAFVPSAPARGRRAIIYNIFDQNPKTNSSRLSRKRCRGHRARAL